MIFGIKTHPAVYLVQHVQRKEFIAASQYWKRKSSCCHWLTFKKKNVAGLW